MSSAVVSRSVTKKPWRAVVAELKMAEVKVAEVEVGRRAGRVEEEAVVVAVVVVQEKASVARGLKAGSGRKPSRG
tara:strand:- start:82 stop:306 length:225 start_codon:yes stop_codon:yes gene_type:complete